MTCTVQNYSHLLLLYFGFYLYALVLAPWIAAKTNLLPTGWFSRWNRVHESCAMRCPQNDCGMFITGRGGKYYIGRNDTQSNIKGCLITMWSFSHFLGYVLLGWVAPCCFWPTFLVGVVFEIYEWYRFECHDVLDPVWNSLGFILGASLVR